MKAINEKSIDQMLDLFAEGVLRFVVGLGKKVLIANNIGLLWESAKRPDFESLRPARRRTRAAWILLVVYLFSTSGVFLLVGFSLLAAAMVEIAMGRAIAYSEALRRQIDPPQRPPPTV